MKAGAAAENFPLDFRRLRRRRRPNDHLILPRGFDSDAAPDAWSPEFDVPPERLREAWFAMIEDEPRTACARDDAEHLQAQFQQRTAVMGFPDDVWVAFLPTGDGGSALAIYSRARHGLTDLGVNKRRCRRWLDLLGRQLAGHQSRAHAAS